MNKWTQEALINVGCRLKYISNIEDILHNEMKHADFMASCFKQFGQFPTNWLFSAQIVHNLLLRKIQIDDASENGLWFSVGGKKARFGQREFCLVTGLRFGKISEIINTPYVATKNGIHKRYWPDEEVEDLKLPTVYDRFVADNFLEADDSLKMALFLIANNILFGQPFDKKVNPWIFNLVDDLEAFNGFKWGHYVFKMTLHYLRHGFRSRNSRKGMARSGTGYTVSRGLLRPLNITTLLQANVKEVLEATDDEARADYWVEVDYNMTEALKRKAQKKKKKTSVKKKQRKAVPVTRLDQDEDSTPGYTPTPHVDYTPGYTPTPLPPHLHMSSRQEPRSKVSGDKITELLEAVRALPDMLDAVVKREVSNLPGLLKSLVQEIQSSRGESNQEVVDPTTENVVGSSGLVSGDLRMGYNYSAEEDRSIRVRLRFTYCMSPFIDPTRTSEKKLQQDNSKYDQFKRKAKPARRNVGTKESVDKSFFMELEDPTKWFSTDHVDAYMSYLAKRRESDPPDNYRHSLVLLSSKFYAKLNLAWKKILKTDNEAESSFDALAFECPQDWIDYSFSNRPGWG
ncbi:hypothetical protein Ddye_000800 [Dipteronia dyeriana]|uniref:DUF1985 domain-containing protein n=1 Tax=Dipteronia dyeriana TaxID=168575 RepID=A0AAD9XMW0_9ROSI|nr:hypothetical protein Ddye_000800 [Dipteronia dyeriana]